MIQTRRNVVFGPQLQIDTVIARYGAWRVLTAALVALLNVRKRRPPPTRTADLSDHVRRDVGLPPAPEPPRYWEYM